jgi:hypothetical protein
MLRAWAIVAAMGFSPMTWQPAGHGEIDDEIRPHFSQGRPQVGLGGAIELVLGDLPLRPLEVQVDDGGHLHLLFLERIEPGVGNASGANDDRTVLAHGALPKRASPFWPGKRTELRALYLPLWPSPVFAPAVYLCFLRDLCGLLPVVCLMDVILPAP